MSGEWGWWRIFVVALLVSPLATSATEGPSTAPDQRAAIERMKEDRRGPFAGIRWFCKDGRILPPTPSACKPYGGGEQYGEWTPEVKQLRADGYYLANVLAEIDVEKFLARPERSDVLAQILLEQFLIAIDDGWILRKARYYRGAFQSESETKAAQRLLEGLVADTATLERHFALLRTATELLPHGKETPSARKVRQLAADLAARDGDFLTLKNKIHARPEPADALAVREYAAAVSSEALQTDLRGLADAIDGLYAAAPVAERLQKAAEGLRESAPAVSQSLMAAADAHARASDDMARQSVLAGLMASIREQIASVPGAGRRVALLDLSRAVEDEYFRVGVDGLPALAGAPRRAQLVALQDAAQAAYGAGLMSARQLRAIEQGVSELPPAPTLAAYREVLQYLARAPSWGSQWLGFHFNAAVERYLKLEPKSVNFVQDQLRGGPLFVYAQMIDVLLRDLQVASGSTSELFGNATGGGLRGLNPGLARGVLKLATGSERVEDFDTSAIYLLPETVSELPPIAGILTAGEGNPLSHVQLLARNLGIPNVGVDARLLDELRAAAGQRVVLAVSAGGAVQIARDGPEWQTVFAAQNAKPDLLIEPDLVRLNLAVRDILPLRELRSTDSGATVGPKAAKLGELKHHYPEAVTEGLALPFGLFRALLEQPMAGKGQSVWEWMTAAYRHAATLPQGSPERTAAEEALRAELEAWLLKADPGPEFRQRLGAAMARTFGPDERAYGVFVRSDTNVEDLAGFTGAGLNLTVPNVVGRDALFESLRRVWASPFTARAFAWRQSHMTAPEHVYTSVLLLKTVPSEKSGVMVTRDVDSGDTDWLSVAVNEGIGGAVDGQAAESLRIHVPTGRVKVLADATATLRRVANPAGGLDKLPVLGRPGVLEPGEIAQLIEFAQHLPERFPRITDASGATTAADVEFAFVGGKLNLLQIRPLNESERARSSSYLIGLDAGWKERADLPVDLDAPPGTGLATAAPAKESTP